MNRPRPLVIAASVFALAGVLIVAAGLFVAAARHGMLSPNDAVLRAIYQLPNSRWIEVDGEPIHYVDEGSGEAVMLLHGSFGSLRMWNDWAKALAAHYRVVRFDMPPMGLSGPNPTGRYDTARQLQIIDRLAMRLAMPRFFLVATSSAGVPGAAYAAEHPERVEGLILSNIAVGRFSIDRASLNPLFKAVLAVDPFFAGWHPRELWRQVLLVNLSDTRKVTPALVQEYADLNNRAQRMPTAADAPSMNATLARTPLDLPHITAPTLLLWSALDHELPPATVGQNALALLGTRDKTLVIVPNCGHIMPIDCGDGSVALALRFLDRVAAAERRP